MSGYSSQRPAAQIAGKMPKLSTKHLEGLCLYMTSTGLCKFPLDKDGRCRLHGLVDGGGG